MEKDIKDKILQHHAQAYGSAAAYENVVILAGYAALFAIWSATNSHYTESNKLISASLMGLSVICYITWHMIQMISMLAVERLKAESFKALPDYKKFIVSWNKAESEYGAAILVFSNRFWLPLFIPSVLFGLSAGILVVYSCAASVFGWPMINRWDK